MKYSNRNMRLTLAAAALALQPAASFASDVEAGRTLYEANCQECHGPDGNGNGPAAEGFVLKPRDFALAAFKFDTDADWQSGTDTDLANVIVMGPAAYGGSIYMPAWDSFGDEDIANLIAFIRSREPESAN